MDAITSSGNYLGTDRLGRPLTNAENKQLSALLRRHDFAGASMIALRFAHKLTRSRERAQDLVGRTNLRLVRHGWDPNVVPLVRCLCRFVWSEHTHQKRETEAAVRAEQAFLGELAAGGERLLPAAPLRGDPMRQPSAEPMAPSTEQQLVRLEREREEDAGDAKELEVLRASLPELREHLRARNDAVNLIWLEQRQKGVTDVDTMARESGRKVSEFYAAAKRRARAVRTVLGRSSGAPTGEDEENE